MQQWQEFTIAVQHLTAKIDRFNENFNQLNPYLNKIGTSEDAEHVRKNLHELSHAIEDSGKQIREDIRELYQLLTSSKRGEEEKREYRAQAGRLLDHFLSKLVEFHHKQREIADRERGSLVRARAARLSLRMHQRTSDTDARSLTFHSQRQRNSFAAPGLMFPEPDIFTRNGLKLLARDATSALSSDHILIGKTAEKEETPSTSGKRA